MLYHEALDKSRLRQALSRARERAGMAALAAIAALLPFELKTPILIAGPLAITNTELALYFALALWGAGRIARRPMRWTRVHTAVAAWAAALLLSALLAPSHRDAALKFALRSWGGCALFFAASHWIDSPRRAAPVVLALIAGAGVSALAALAEVWLPGAATSLLAFKTQTSLAGSYVRASGTFQYANIGAMYWEAVLPPVLTLGMGWGLLRTWKAGRWMAIGIALVLIEAVILSASRAGIFGTGILLAAMLGLAWRTFPAIRAASAASLIALVALGLINLAASPLFALRIQTESDADWYRASYDLSSLKGMRIEAGQMITMSVRVRNEGALAWPAFGETPIFLSYHWYDADSDQIAVYNGVRTPLPQDVPPEAEAVVPARVRAPGKPGSYILQWDMLHENVIWFSAKGAGTGDVPVQVVPSTGKAPPIDPPDVTGELIQSTPSRLDLWRAALHLWLPSPLLGIGPDNFRHRYGLYLGLHPFDDRIHTNNLYVEMLVNLGVLGAAAFAGVMITLAQAAWQGRRQIQSQDGQALTLGVLAGLAAFFVHGLFDYFFEFTATYALFWLLAGMAVGLLRERGA